MDPNPMRRMCSTIQCQSRWSGRDVGLSLNDAMFLDIGEGREQIEWSSHIYGVDPWLLFAELVIVKSN